MLIVTPTLPCIHLILTRSISCEKSCFCVVILLRFVINFYTLECMCYAQSQIIGLLSSHGSFWSKCEPLDLFQALLALVTACRGNVLNVAPIFLSSRQGMCCKFNDCEVEFLYFCFGLVTGESFRRFPHQVKTKIGEMGFLLH